MQTADALIENHEKMVRHLARRLRRELALQGELDDLVEPPHRVDGEEAQDHVERHQDEEQAEQRVGCERSSEWQVAVGGQHRAEEQEDQQREQRARAE